MTEDLKVPKRRVQVEVLAPGSPPRRVSFFLAEFASTHSGPERLEDLLASDLPFVPALDAATGETLFLHRRSIAAARVSSERELGDDPVQGQRHELEIELSDGTLLQGTVWFAPPPERTRLLDCLNDGQRFLRVAEKDRVALVSKRHIARVAKAK